MIFQHIKDPMAIVCLSLVNNIFFSIGYAYLVSLYEDQGPAESWAGDRLICVGDYCDIDDLPEAVFTDSEKNALDKFATEYEDDRSLYRALGSGELQIGSARAKLFDKAFVARVKAMKKALPALQRKKCQELLDIPDVIEFLYEVDPAHPWALCNLTTGEYVRADAISKMAGPDETDNGPDVGHGLTFGEVIGARISWSTDGSVAMSYDGDLHRGVWAGHRFQIIRMDQMGHLGNGRKWKDVSEEVTKEMQAIWESEFGRDWQQYL